MFKPGDKIKLRGPVKSSEESADWNTYMLIYVGKTLTLKEKLKFHQDWWSVEEVSECDYGMVFRDKYFTSAKKIIG